MSTRDREETVQKNFRIARITRDSLDRWRKTQGYHEGQFILAALYAFTQLTHAERIRWFQALDEWQSRGSPL